MSTTAWILTVGFTALVLLGVPFAFAIALSVIAVLLFVGIEPMLLPQTLVAGTQSFSLLAIPFFMLAGELMLAGGLSRRLVRVAEVFVRHLPGGLGLVVVLQASADSLIERIRQRGVPMEQSMSEDYLRSLSEAYTNYFHHYDQSPLLIVNTDQLNPIDREKDFDALIQQIANYRGRRSFFNALHD